MQGAANQLKEEALAKAALIEAGFRDQLGRNGLRGNWEIGRGVVGEVVARRARTANLVVLGQADPRIRCRRRRAP